MKDNLYKTLGDVKCAELNKKYESFWEILDLSDSRKNAQVSGTVIEGIAKDFIREFLPVGFTIKSGLVLNTETRKMSPQIDGIIFSGAPLLGFTDVAVVDKNQVKAVLEFKSWIHTTALFGDLKGKSRDPNSGLAHFFNQIKDFVPQGAKYILFTFELSSRHSDIEVMNRLKRICDSYAVVVRKEPKAEQLQGKEQWECNFNGSVSKLIKWLRNLK